MKKITRKIVEIDEDLCNGCGQCILDCAEGAITLIDGKAKVIADMYCDGLGACLSGCPTGALSLTEREADAYDEEAVHEHLAKQGKTLHAPGHGRSSPGTGSGCPGAKSASFAPLPFGGGLGAPSGRHWPLKLRLMPVDAGFLRGADILLAADCTAFAAENFHGKLGGNNVILIACPKFEGGEVLTERLAELFRAAKPASCTVARMEVPCCKALIKACHDANAAAGTEIPVQEIIITRAGEIQGRG